MVVDFSGLRSQYNPVYWDLRKARNRYLVIYGGAGSGKSHAAAQIILERFVSDPGRNVLVVRKVRNTIRDSVFNEMLSLAESWGVMPLLDVNRTNYEIRCINGNTMVFRGMDNPEKIKSLKFLKGHPTDVWVEEATDLSFNDLTQINLRLRAKSAYKKQIILTLNPIDVEHWIKTKLLDNPRQDVHFKRTTYKDNKWLDDEYKRELELLKSTNPYYYNVYALGEWGIVGNVVFSNYVVENIKYEEEDFDGIYNGQDFGYNHYSATVRVGIKDGELYVFDEIYVRQKTIEDVAKIVKSRIPHDQTITCDSAEPGSIQTFRAHGIKARPARKGKDSVSHGINWLKSERLHISPNCVGLIKEIKYLQYVEDKRTGEPTDDISPGIGDDAIAALRYAIEPLRLAQQARVTEGVSLWR